MNQSGHRIIEGDYLIGSPSPVEIAPGIFVLLIEEIDSRNLKFDSII
jgi:hypothetical protein